jgi:Family of unknown function (DUF5994)
MSGAGSKLKESPMESVVRLNRRRLASPIRLTLASTLGGHLDGAWWPYSSSVARELPELIEALERRLGQVVDIGINWSVLDGVPDLDTLVCHGKAVVPGQQPRHPRVMTVTGNNASARLLVVPCQTTTALAVMVMRRAAALPIYTAHLDTAACRTADVIIRAARGERVPSTAPENSSS